MLGIGDPRTDDRIDFIGGIRGLSELERRADSDCEVAFAMYPTSIQELFAVADAGSSDAAEIHLVRAEASERTVYS